ncbi:DUF397 domain-containing protein [Streptomyces sp. SID3343]|uniref:DUF397 domain-containing protein n=1 Tax=Streptomyces sp. SID3343 TaxID=2690260 RepID=UPI00136C05B2|nr:DUF397 domain-containing protein [Streptomyces sp. SID3343]MYW00972.1 DUF397 domain-containing protein [Streptomyces sp. SID3343]
MNVTNETPSQPIWRKSGYSQQDDACVEIATVAQSVVARDSKVVGGPVLGFGGGQWDGLVSVLRVRCGG